jgi:hypothetical protein
MPRADWRTLFVGSCKPLLGSGREQCVPFREGIRFVLGHALFKDHPQMTRAGLTDARYLRSRVM